MRMVKSCRIYHTLLIHSRTVFYPIFFPHFVTYLDLEPLISLTRRSLKTPAFDVRNVAPWRLLLGVDIWCQKEPQGPKASTADLPL